MDLDPSKKQDFINICGKYTEVGGSGLLFVTFCERKDASKDFSGN